MSFSGCSVCDYSSGHVPNLWPKGWLVVIMRVSTVLVQLKRQNLFCIEKCRCSERERGSSTPLGAAAAAGGGGGGGWRRGARRQYAPALHLSSIPAAPLQRAGVCRGIPGLQPHPERLRPSTRGGGGRGSDCGELAGATDADGRDILTALILSIVLTWK